MKVVKCVNGHFFDEDKYTQCPHCGGATSGSIAPGGATPVSVSEVSKKEESAGEGDKKKKRWLFGGKKKNEDENIVEEQPEYSIPLVDMDDDKTVLIEPVIPPASVMERPQTFNAQQLMSQQVLQPMVSQQTSQTMPTPQTVASLVEITQCKQSDNMQTVAFYDSVVEPVTGWLVCIKGESYGESFEIKAGRNNIGRGTNMDIPLLKEMSVSRDKHAVIVFDPINLKFLIQSGENGLTYVNGELLMGVKDLEANDKIMLGTAIFVFIPFCGEYFDWKNHQNN